MSQFFIAFFGVSALIMLQSDFLVLRRWANVVGLAGQPFWLYATASAEQWGMFPLCVAYTVAYIWGVYKHFWSK